MKCPNCNHATLVGDECSNCGDREGTGRDTFNGWTNRETWAANLYLREHGDRRDTTAEALRADVQAEVDDLISVPGDIPESRRTRLIAIGSLWQVNWQEIADALAEADHG